MTLTLLLLGFLMGVRHAFEPDHLAAVASLATRTRSVRAGILQGAAWGLGHTLTLLLVGGTCLYLGEALPERWAHRLETAVGVMLVLLGADVVRRMRRERLHFHVHQHQSGPEHWHAHRHGQESAHETTRHEHPHPQRFPFRALVVGLVHGLAGSAALFLLTLQATASPGVGLVYVGVFGVGSILGMASLSAVIAFPLFASAGRLTRVRSGLEAFVGLTTIAVGVGVLYHLLG